MDDPNDPKNWTPLHYQVEAYNKIRELITGPKQRIPEALVRRTLADQYGCKPEEVTPKQINLEVAGLLRYYPAIELIPTIAPANETGELAPTPHAKTPEAVGSATILAESLAKQIKDLQIECDVTTEEMAEALDVDPRSIYRHLAGVAIPRRKHIVAYEEFFSIKLDRKVTLKRQRNVSKKSP